jgi:hypothetical protein
MARHAAPRDFVGLHKLYACIPPNWWSCVPPAIWDAVVRNLPTTGAVRQDA